MLYQQSDLAYEVAQMASLFLTKAPALPIDVPKCEPAGTVLGGLVIQDLPSRVHKTVTRTQQAAYELEQSLEEERQHAAVLEAAAVANGRCFNGSFHASFGGTGYASSR
jgi:hypothetical protein